MSKARPGRAQVSVLHLEPKRAAATLGYAFMTLLAVAVAVAAVLYRTDVWPETWRFQPDVAPGTPPLVAAVAGVLACLFFVGMLVNARRWHIARVIERLSEDPRMAALLPSPVLPPQRERATTVPPLEVSIVKARKLPKPRAKLRLVTASRNVIGERPLRITYLRLFENQPRIRTFMEGAWREFGYVYLLRSAASVTPREYRAAKKSGDVTGIFVRTPEHILAALRNGAVHQKGRHWLRTVGPTTIRTRDRYGSYGVHAFLCHGMFWKAAVDLLLERADLVALDLSGFRPENVGVHYELQRVVDTVPIDQVVFLADPRSNKKFITEQLRLAWSEMAVGSPNAVGASRRAIVVVTDSIARQTSQATRTAGTPGQPGQQVQQTQVRVRLVARRRETRRVVAMAQARLNGQHVAPV